MSTLRPATNRQLRKAFAALCARDAQEQRQLAAHMALIAPPVIVLQFVTDGTAPRGTRRMDLTLALKTLRVGL